MAAKSRSPIPLGDVRFRRARRGTGRAEVGRSRRAGRALQRARPSQPEPKAGIPIVRRQPAKTSNLMRSVEVSSATRLAAS